MVTRRSECGAREKGEQKKNAKRARREPDASSLQDEAEKLVVLADEDGRAENGGPKTALVADGGLRDVSWCGRFCWKSDRLLFFRRRQIRIEFHVQRRREHFRGEFFGIFAGDFLGFTEGVMLGQITVHRFVAGSASHAGSDEPVRFLGGVFADDRERDLPGPDVLQPSLREINLQLGGKMEETRTMLHAAIPAFRRASSKLESLSRCLPTPLVRKILSNERHVPVCRASVSSVPRETFSRCEKVTRRIASVNAFPT